MRLLMRLLRKCAIGFIALLLLFSICACGDTSNNATNASDISNAPVTSDDISATNDASFTDTTAENLMIQMENAILQYPSSNEEWKYNVYDCYIELTDYIGPEVEALTIPSELEGLPVWSINTGRIYDGGRGDYNDILTSVEFPDCLLVIGDETFLWCRELTSFTFPDTLVSIGESAFENCYRLSALFLPDGLRTIEDKAFDGVRFTISSVPTISVPASVTEIGYAAFRYIVYENDETPGLDYGYEITILNENVQLGDACFDNALVIYGYAGSTTAQYCADYNKTFRLIEQNSFTDSNVISPTP